MTLTEHDRLSRDGVNQLVLAIATRQDREVFAELFNLAAPRLKGLLMRSGSTAEIAEEAMLMVWRKAPYSDPPRAGAVTWIFTIAGIDFQRKSEASNYAYSDQTGGMQAADPCLQRFCPSGRMRDFSELLPAAHCACRSVKADGLQITYSEQ